MKLVSFLISMVMLLLCAVGAGIADSGSCMVSNGNQMEEVQKQMKMKIGDTPVEVAWEDNDSVEALMELAAGGLTIRMSMYGGFEQVGAIGERLPSSDVQTTTNAGDIVLYSGSQLVVFYGSNSWAYTRLGRITDKSAAEMRTLLSRGDVTITIYTE